MKVGLSPSGKLRVINCFKNNKLLSHLKFQQRKIENNVAFNKKSEIIKAKVGTPNLTDHLLSPTYLTDYLLSLTFLNRSLTSL